MTALQRSLMWAATAVMVAVALLSQFVRPTVAEQGGPLAMAVPERFGSWRLDPDTAPVAPTPDVQQDLDRIYDEIVSRTYVDAAGRRVMLIVAHGGDQSDSMKAHRQEVCYAAQGFDVRNIANAQLHLRDGSSSPLIRMHARKADRSEPVSYWFTMGDTIALGRAERLMVQIRHGLAGRIPDGLLVRVSTFDEDARVGYAVQDDFLRQLLGAMSPQTRHRLGVAPRS